MTTMLDIAPTRLERDGVGGDLWTLNFGPQHPATHTTLRLVLDVDGEIVVACTHSKRRSRLPVRREE